MLTCTHIYACGKTGPEPCCSMSQSPSRKGSLGCGGSKMQCASLTALKQKLPASAALSVQEMDCFSVPVAVDKCGGRDAPRCDSNSEGCFRTPVPHRYTQQSSAYNQAVEIRLQALAHNSTSDLTVTPGEEQTPHLTHSCSGFSWMSASSWYWVSACTARGASLPSQLFPSLKIAAVKEKSSDNYNNKNKNPQ